MVSWGNTKGQSHQVQARLVFRAMDRSPITQDMPVSNPPLVHDCTTTPTSAGDSSPAHPSRPTSAHVASKVGLIIGVLLIPFLDHKSAAPDILTYSFVYLAFLGVLVTAAIGFSQILALLVCKAPLPRQMPFALLVLVGLVGSILAAECFLGYVDRDAFAWYRSWGHVRSPLTGFVVKPGHRWQMSHDGGRTTTTYTTDSLGLRTHLRPRVNPSEEVLIVAVGGSAVFGYGLNDNETWVHLLEGQLRERFGERVTVLNAGCNGHNTLQQLIRYHTTVRTLAPNLVVHYGAINDIRPDEKLAQLIPFPDELVETRTSREYLSTANRGRGFYFEHSLLIDRLMRSAGSIARQYSHASSQPVAVPQASAPVQFDMTAALFVENLNAMRTLAESNRTDFVPITFLANLDQLVAPYDDGVRVYVKHLRDHWQSKGLPVIDLWLDYLQEAQPASLFVADNYHPSKRGAAFIAEHVAEALAPRVAAYLASNQTSANDPAPKKESFPSTAAGVRDH